MRHALLPPLLACVILLPAIALADIDDDNDTPAPRAPGAGLVLTSAQQQAARDSVLAIGPFLNQPNDAPPPSREEAQSIIEKIEVLQGQLILVDSFMQGLSEGYKQFLAAHTN